MCSGHGGRRERSVENVGAVSKSALSLFRLRSNQQKVIPVHSGAVANTQLIPRQVN